MLRPYLPGVYGGTQAEDYNRSDFDGEAVVRGRTEGMGQHGTVWPPVCSTSAERCMSVIQLICFGVVNCCYV